MVYEKKGRHFIPLREEEQRLIWMSPLFHQDDEIGTRQFINMDILLTKDSIYYWFHNGNGPPIQHLDSFPLNYCDQAVNLDSLPLAKKRAFTLKYEKDELHKLLIGSDMHGSIV